MFMLRSDLTLVMYEETAPHLPMDNQIRKEYFNLMSKGGVSPIKSFNDKSIDITFKGKGKKPSSLIITFKNKDERYDWLTCMSGDMEPGEEEVSDDDDKASVHSMVQNADIISRNTMKLKGQVESKNFCNDHRTLVNQTLKDRLDDKETKLTKYMASAYNQNKILE